MSNSITSSCKHGGHLNKRDKKMIDIETRSMIIWQMFNKGGGNIKYRIASKMGSNVM